VQPADDKPVLSRHSLSAYQKRHHNLIAERIFVLLIRIAASSLSLVTIFLHTVECEV
jgi:hypothetical protein